MIVTLESEQVFFIFFFRKKKKDLHKIIALSNQPEKQINVTDNRRT
jgi:hypothetical protein